MMRERGELTPSPRPSPTRGEEEGEAEQTDLWSPPPGVGEG